MWPFNSFHRQVMGWWSSIFRSEPDISPPEPEPASSSDCDPENYDMPKTRESEVITLDPNHDLFYFFAFKTAASDPEVIDAFAAKKCKQKSNYIKESAAKRLQLPSARGSMHELAWRSAEMESNPTTRQSKFIVVRDDEMDIEVALGTDFSAGGVVEAQNESSTNNSPLKYPPPSRVDSSTNLYSQIQGLKGSHLQNALKHLIENGTLGTANSSWLPIRLETEKIVLTTDLNQLRTLYNADVMSPRSTFMPPRRLSLRS